MAFDCELLRLAPGIRSLVLGYPARDLGFGPTLAAQFAKLLVQRAPGLRAVRSCTDRRSAIAVLRGVVEIGWPLGPGPGELDVGVAERARVLLRDGANLFEVRILGNRREHEVTHVAVLPAANGEQPDELDGRQHEQPEQPHEVRTELVLEMESDDVDQQQECDEQ